MIPINDVRFVHDAQERIGLALEGWVEIPSELDYVIMVHPVAWEKTGRKRSVHERLLYII